MRSSSVADTSSLTRNPWLGLICYFGSSSVAVISSRRLKALFPADLSVLEGDCHNCLPSCRYHFLQQPHRRTSAIHRQRPFIRPLPNHGLDAMPDAEVNIKAHRQSLGIMVMTGIGSPRCSGRTEWNFSETWDLEASRMAFVRY